MGEKAKGGAGTVLSSPFCLPSELMPALPFLKDTLEEDVILQVDMLVER